MSLPRYHLLGKPGGTGGGPSFDFSGGLPSGSSFARASSAYRTNANGFLEQQAINVPRFDYMNSILLGLLIEPQATNICPNSAALDSWSAINTIVTPNTTTAPDGTMTADTAALLATSAGSRSILYQNLGVLTGYSSSIWAQGALGTERIYLFSNNNGSQAQAVIQPSTSMQRYSFSDTATSSGYIECGVDTQNSGPIQPAAPAQTVMLWGCQFEAGLRTTSYIPTTSGSATRAADVLTLNWGAKGVSDGPINIKYTFDDLSTQTNAETVSSGVTIVPTNLNRPWIRSAVKV